MIKEQIPKRRIRLPETKNQIIGTVIKNLGGSRFSIDCSDGITRMARMPKKLKRHLWLKSGDVVLIDIWEFQSDHLKSDIIWKYKREHIQWLRNNGYLNF